MSTFKITNITNQAGKRDFKYNSILDIEYVDGMSKKTAKIRPGDTMFLTVSTLPLSVQRLKLQNLITVVQIDAAELAKVIDAMKPKVVVLPSVETDEEKNAERKSGKRRIHKTADSEADA